MGCGASSLLVCPRCDVQTFTNSQQLLLHLKQKHQFGSFVNPKPQPTSVTKCKFCNVDVVVDQLADHLQAYHIQPLPPIVVPITCPQCGRNDIPNGQILLEHLKMYHGLTDKPEPPPVTKRQMEACKNCNAQIYQDEMAEHLQKMHIDHVENQFACPKCDKKDLKNGEEFLKHLMNAHSFSHTKLQNTTSSPSSAPMHGNKKLPKVGDKVLAMWSQSRWQYFHATIVRFLADNLQYEIDWDDGDTTGRTVDYYNIAVDKVPDEMEIGIGSVILFPQGAYTAGQTQLTGGKRWHQGEITDIYSQNGEKFYNGIHTKGKTDGKFVTYKGYSERFTGYRREDFRVGPNVFNILDTGTFENDITSADDIDIYFSCSNDEKDSTYDPSSLKAKLQERGLSVVKGDDGSCRNDLMVKVNMMKNSKVVIACISDDYSKNEQCRMEFQYAKSTLRKPVVPVVCGNGTAWTMSVVGMLIAGELYIHFKDKSVEEQKLEEVMRSLSTHISKLSDVVNTREENTTDLGPGDVFISYCWSNSWDALQNNQISNLVGTQHSDPRAVSRNLFDSGYKTWLDIERLKSADQSAGLYEQLTEALKNAKLVVPCISDEYAASVNCQMEFKFAVNSLRKKVIPIIVGKGDAWKQTVVGALMSSNNIEPLDFQMVKDEEDFKTRLKELMERLKGELDIEPSTADASEETKPTVEPRKSCAPRVGDHVVSHHFNWNYYMATVVCFDRSTMKYTVAWDDGDTTGTVQDFNQVAKDVEPRPDEIGVGSYIFFPQGSYVGTEGSNEGGIRYHEGIITSIKRGDNTLVSGKHTRGTEDGKRCRYRDYSHEFYDIPIHKLRLAPTALESFGI